MNWSELCQAVIPCLNEQEHIAEVVRGVRAHLPHVCVIDDGSTDATAQQAEAAGAQVIRHERTLGKGCALRAGWWHARGMGFRWALMLDGDGQHSPEDIPLFFQTAEHTGAQLVIGNRMPNAVGNMPPLRRFVNQWMSRKISKRAGQFLPDTQCGFRLLDLSASAIPLGGAEHYEIESELVLRFARSGARVAWVPVRVIYRRERSKINPVLDSVRWLRWWTRKP